MALDYKKLQESLNKQLKEKGISIEAELVEEEDHVRLVRRECKNECGKCICHNDTCEGHE